MTGPSGSASSDLPAFQQLAVCLSCGHVLGGHEAPSPPAKALGHTVSLGHFSIRSVSVQEVENGPPVPGTRRVCVQLNVRANAATGELCGDISTPVVLVRRFASDLRADTAGIIRALIIEALTHELDEWLRIDGKQLVDPHADTKHTTERKEPPP